MLTVFTTPKPFIGHIGLIQRNALGSWRHIADSERFLLGEAEGAAEAAGVNMAHHIPDIACNPWGTPYISALFAQAERVAQGNLLCYSNADILLPSNLAAVAAAVASTMPRFILVGRRWNVDVDVALDFSPGWEDQMRDHARRTGRLHPSTGIDYFVFPKGMLGADLPPFSVGRVRWDNWMLYNARLLDIPVIDATKVVDCWHQNHDYGHIQRDTLDHTDTDEQRFNKMLAFGEFFAFTLDDCSHVLLTDGKVVSAVDRGRTPRAPATCLLSNSLRWMMVPGEMSEALLDDQYRPGLFALLNRLLRPGMVFLDVGAHHGAVSLAAHRRVGPDGLVVAVEPSVREQMVLRMQLALNRIKDIQLFTEALTDHRGAGIFHINRSLENGRNAIRPPLAMVRGRQVPVQLDTLDALMERLSPRSVDVVKISLSDVDLSILRGAADTLSAGGLRPVLLLDPDWDQPDVQALMAAADYRLVPMPDVLAAFPSDHPLACDTAQGG